MSRTDRADKASRAQSGTSHLCKRLMIGALLAIAACRSTPTEPDTIDLSGVWLGALPIRLPDHGDWSDSRLTLDQNGLMLSGDLSNGRGAHFQVSGSVAVEGTAVIRIDGLPGTSTCAAVSLIVERIQNGPVPRLIGRVSGRCFGTVAGDFQLLRAED